MDFKDQIKQIGDRVNKTKNMINTEEATKHSLVMPFLQALGFDVFNPMEVVPEFVADLGIKQGEKVDYAIFKDGKPIILIECKWHGANLDVHNSQLFRYFHVSKAQFGLLTNGIEYRFYTDLLETNKMDEKPFFTFNITDIKDAQIEELKKFHRNYYNHETIINTASELKYMGELKHIIHQQINEPSPDFVKLLARNIYNGVITQKVLDQFTLLIKHSFTNYINDLITDRLKSALHKEEEIQNELPLISEAGNLPVEQKIITTQEEIEAVYIVKAILRGKVALDRIFMRDAQSYCAVLLDDNNRKPICRLYFNGTKKYLATFDENKKEVKTEIKSIDDLYGYSNLLEAAVEVYLKVPVAGE